MKKIKNECGFTLVEIIAVLLLIAIIGAIAYSRYDALGPSAADRVAGMFISDMNMEALNGWTQSKFTAEGWVSDENILKHENYSNFPLHNNYLTIKQYQIKVRRIPSEFDKPARWEKE
jgi:prepilin-type N-terminal cleavage/methylation domain-containing protein